MRACNLHTTNYKTVRTLCLKESCFLSNPFIIDRYIMPHGAMQHLLQKHLTFISGIQLIWLPAMDEAVLLCVVVQRKITFNTLHMDYY